jgi:hypothetical protein
MTFLKGGVDSFSYFSLISVILFSNQKHHWYIQFLFSFSFCFFELIMTRTADSIPESFFELIMTRTADSIPESFFELIMTRAADSIPESFFELIMTRAHR